MTQKVLRVGTSAAVTIPKSILADLRLSVGDQVRVEVDNKRQTLLVTPADQVHDQELLDWTKKFTTHYQSALEALSKK